MKFHLDPGDLHPTIKGNCLHYIASLPDDKPFVVEVKKPKRTNPQNDRFHAMCGELGDEIGYTLDEMKRLVKNELGRYQVIDGPCGKIKRLESSADWDKDEMSAAIELLIRWGAEVGHRWRVQ